MRRVFLLVLTASLFMLGTARGQTEEARMQEAVKTGDIIRLHVVAAGDDAENQRIKLCVRDKVLLAWRGALSRQDNAQDMMAFLEDNRQALEEAASKAAREEGFSGKVSAQVGVFPFPDRWYGSVLVPAGEYRALRIVLGSGEGKNWWCVLFPSLCLSLAAQDVPPLDATAKPGEDADFTWRVWDIFCAWPLMSPV